MMQMSVQFLITLLKIQYIVLLLLFLLIATVCLCWFQLHMISGAMLMPFNVVFPGH
jgi:hypothetical protein